MAVEKHAARETTKIVPDIMSLRDVARTKNNEDIRARTETLIIATTATNTIIANSGCRAILVQVAAVTTTTTKINIGTITADDDRILENSSAIPVIVHRNRVTHRHHHRLRHQIDTHGGHMIADNPLPQATDVELSFMPCEMSNGRRGFDRER
jgi:hypothetical protein